MNYVRCCDHQKDPLAVVVLQNSNDTKGLNAARCDIDRGKVVVGVWVGVFAAGERE